MSQSQSKIVRHLTSAQQTRKPVTVLRKGLEFDETSGFVISVMDEWVVIRELNDMVYLDDYVLLRLDYVTRVETLSERPYVERAVAGLGVELGEFVCAPNISTADLLRLVNQRADLVGMYLENRKSYWFMIGKVLRIGNKRLDLHYIGREGGWTKFVEAWKLKVITRIEFGGRYIRALEQFGEPMPSVTKRVKR